MRQIHFLGKMPDPFLLEDGTRMTPDQWWQERKALLKRIVESEYGTLPPRPEYIRVTPLTDFRKGSDSQWHKVFVGTKEKQLSFNLELYVPESYEEGKKYPVLLTGDGCYDSLESDTVAEAHRRGFIAAKFNRLDFANDVKDSREGGLHDIYPGRYSDISAWAWGYCACMDVLEMLPFTDETHVGITGHSRGGKTVMLAAAVDERFRYVCPNNSGCHGAVSYRCHVTGQGAPDHITETMESMLVKFPTWMGDNLWNYQGRIQELPYDMHYFGAMIAPRFYFQCEGMQDYWINPIGAWQNFAAVKQCYRYLGCENNAVAWFRPGKHRHKLPDFTEFLDLMEREMKGQPMAEHWQVNPYPDIPLNFDW